MVQLKTESGDPVFPIGIGTYEIASRENPDTYEALKTTGYKNVEAVYGNEEKEIAGLERSLMSGQNYVDTAGMYGAGYTDVVVGKALANISATRPRDSLFIAHNVWKSDFDRIEAAVISALTDLNIDYFDVAGPHSPHTDGWNVPAWQSTMVAFSRLLDQGLIRGVSVSNFSPQHIQEAEQLLGRPVTTAQMGFSVVDQKNENLAYCQRHDIQVVGYSPLKGTVLENPVVRELAASRKVAPAQIALAYVVNLGVLPITKAINPGHIDANVESGAIELSPSEMQALTEGGQVDREST